MSRIFSIPQYGPNEQPGRMQKASDILLKPLRHASNRDVTALARIIAIIATFVLLPFILLGMLFASLGQPYRISVPVQIQTPVEQIVEPLSIQNLIEPQAPSPQNLPPLALPPIASVNSVRPILPPPPKLSIHVKLGYTKEQKKILKGVYTSIQEIVGSNFVNIGKIRDLINKKSPELKATLIHPLAYILEAREMKLNSFAQKPSPWRPINSAIYSAFINGAVEGIHSYNTWDYAGKNERDISVNRYLKDFCTLTHKDYAKTKVLIDDITYEQSRELSKNKKTEGVFSAIAIKKCEELFTEMLS